MYVYVYVYIHIYIYICTYTCIHIYVCIVCTRRNHSFCMPSVESKNPDFRWTVISFYSAGVERTFHFQRLPPDDTLCYTILYYTILWYTIQYYTILCYTMLYYAILSLRPLSEPPRPPRVEVLDRPNRVFEVRPGRERTKTARQNKQQNTK